MCILNLAHFFPQGCSWHPARDTRATQISSCVFIFWIASSTNKKGHVIFDIAGLPEAAKTMSGSMQLVGPLGKRHGLSSRARNMTLKVSTMS